MKQKRNWEKKTTNHKIGSLKKVILFNQVDKVIIST